MSRNARQLKAASTGRVLNAFLELYFQTYVDFDFTADMEAKLDKISGVLLSRCSRLSQSTTRLLSLYGC